MNSSMADGDKEGEIEDKIAHLEEEREEIMNDDSLDR